MLQSINSLSALRSALADLRSGGVGGGGGDVALVPTMGALHAGHMRLVDVAKSRAAHVVVSIFVNPAQFGPNEDLDAYPRTMAEDAALLEAAGVALLWAPPPAQVYPPGFATSVSVHGVSDHFCGASRPGHFDGVALVVAKLFNQVRPDIALFGEKDWQQLAVIRRMARDLDFDLTIEGVPTVREADGLALSSRNRYLTADQRAAAAALPRALQAAASAIARGVAVEAALHEARTAIFQAGFDSIDYLDLADADALQPLATIGANSARLLVAARIGRTRLIDNWPIC